MVWDGGRKAGANRVIRGGSWNNNARNVRAAYRNHNDPDNRNDNLGFRCARAHNRTERSGPEQIAIPGVPPGSPKLNGRRRAGSGEQTPRERSSVGRFLAAVANPKQRESVIEVFV